MGDKTFRGGCLQCPQSEDFLPLDTVLYNGFGGYSVYKDHKLVYVGNARGEWTSFKTLAFFEKRARKENGEWSVELSTPLRGATWERIGEGSWALTDTNQGFA